MLGFSLWERGMQALQNRTVAIWELKHYMGQMTNIFPISVVIIVIEEVNIKCSFITSNL